MKSHTSNSNGNGNGNRRSISSNFAEDSLWLKLAIWFMYRTFWTRKDDYFDENDSSQNKGGMSMSLSLETSFLGLLLLCVLRVAVDNTGTQHCKKYWTGRPDADSGSLMSMVLLPACSVVMAGKDSKYLYSLLLVLLANEHPESWLVALLWILAGLWFVLFGLQDLLGLLGFVLIWSALATYSKPFLETVLTCGEFRILVSLVTTALLGWIIQITNMLGSDSPVHHQAPQYAIVALSGVVGCGVSLILSQRISKSALLYRILLNIAGPLVLVEITLWQTGFANRDFETDLPLPMWCLWLFQFLQSPENDESNSHGSSWPRYYGLLYWFSLAVLFTFPTLRIVNTPSVGVVVRRKWFHAMAVLLFGPITWIFPQLMGLSYAIALCGLAVLECLRRDIPVLQDFYKVLIDPHKDNPQDILFSHIFLILGCAMPLWMQQVHCLSSKTPFDDEYKHDDHIYNYSSNNSNNILLSQWGVLSLGIGDAMGALVGTYFGRHRWGRNRRTLEGSAAMWISMMCVGLILSPLSSWYILLLATTFCTMLEAYTLQMDNFILPLAGCVILVSLW